jgi:hypothetical protein
MNLPGTACKVNVTLSRRANRNHLDKIADSRTQFLELPVTIFDVLESEQWRQDLYLFSVEAVPLDRENAAAAWQKSRLISKCFLQNDLNAGPGGAG